MSPVTGDTSSTQPVFQQCQKMKKSSKKRWSLSISLWAPTSKPRPKPNDEEAWQTEKQVNESTMQPRYTNQFLLSLLDSPATEILVETWLVKLALNIFALNLVGLFPLNLRVFSGVFFGFFAAGFFNAGSSACGAASPGFSPGPGKAFEIHSGVRSCRMFNANSNIHKTRRMVKAFSLLDCSCWPFARPTLCFCLWFRSWVLRQMLLDRATLCTH